MKDSFLREYAVMGARAKLEQLEHEKEEIYRSFPELKPVSDKPMSDAFTQIVAYVSEHGRTPLSELLAELKLSRNMVWNAASKAVRVGALRRVKRGVYEAPKNGV